MLFTMGVFILFSCLGLEAISKVFKIDNQEKEAYYL